MAELAASPPGEIDRIAQDMGLGKADLLALACSHTGHDELMPKRLRQLGLDPVFIEHAQPAIYRELARVCSSCKAGRRCARDLAHGDVQTGMHSYCLNASTIDALLVTPPDRAR
jgi:hypothetical protein